MTAGKNFRIDQGSRIIAISLNLIAFHGFDETEFQEPDDHHQAYPSSSGLLPDGLVLDALNRSSIGIP